MRASRLAVAALAVVVATVLLTYVGLALFAAPSADDDCYAVKARTPNAVVLAR